MATNWAAEKTEVGTQHLELKEYSSDNSDIGKEEDRMSPPTEKQQL